MIAIGPFLFPSTNDFKNDTSNSVTLDAADDRQALIFRIPKTGNITHIGISTRFVSSAQAVSIGLETVDLATGYPTSHAGVVYGGSVAGSIATPTTNTAYEVALTTQASAIVGDSCAIVAKFSGTAGSLSMQSQSVRGGWASAYSSFVTSGTAYTSKNTGTILQCYIKYDDGSYFLVSPGCGPLHGNSGVNSVAFNSGSTADERGNVFTLPVGLEVTGIWAALGFSASSAADLILADSSGVTLSGGTIPVADGDATGGSGTGVYSEYPFAAPIILSTATTYRLLVKPTTTNNVSLGEWSFLSTAVMDGYVSGGSAWYRCTRVDGGSFSDTTTARSMIGLIVKGVDAGGGGGRPELRGSNL